MQPSIVSSISMSAVMEPHNCIVHEFDFAVADSAAAMPVTDYFLFLFGHVAVIVPFIRMTGAAVLDFVSACHCKNSLNVEARNPLSSNSSRFAGPGSFTYSDNASPVRAA